MEQLERDGAHHEQIQRSDTRSVTAQESLPTFDGGGRRGTIYLPTVDSATSIPSINNSPWIRSAPHSGFSRFIRRLSARIPESVRGRPPTWRISSASMRGNRVGASGSGSPAGR